MKTPIKKSSFGYKSWTFVLVQFSSILALIYLNEGKYNILSILIVILSLTIVFSAFFEMRKSKFSIFPNPESGSVLIQTGIYKYIRHPMYTSVIIFCVSQIVIIQNIISYLIFFILVVNLILKSSYEENLLSKKFSDYKLYILNTKRFIPFVW